MGEVLLAGMGLANVKSMATVLIDCPCVTVLGVQLGILLTNVEVLPVGKLLTPTCTPSTFTPTLLMEKFTVVWVLVDVELMPMVGKLDKLDKLADVGVMLSVMIEPKNV